MERDTCRFQAILIFGLASIQQRNRMVGTGGQEMYLVGLKGKAGRRLEFEDEIDLLWKTLFNPLTLDYSQVFVDLMNLRPKVCGVLSSLYLPQWGSVTWSPCKIHAIRAV